MSAMSVAAAGDEPQSSGRAASSALSACTCPEGFVLAQRQGFRGGLSLQGAIVVSCNRGQTSYDVDSLSLHSSAGQQTADRVFSVTAHLF